MLSTSLLRGTALVLLAASVVLSQVTPSISTNPLGTSSFTTPFFSPSPQTYTITTTYPVNTPTTGTVISGNAGPSPATGAYTFSYPIPLNSATMTPLSSLYASLASAGEPTAFTSAFQPQVSDLDIVDSAPSSYKSTVGVLLTMVVGVAVGMAMV